MRRKQPAATPPDIGVSTITPADAAAFLNNNTNNYRTLRAAVVARYAADMKDGNWVLTGAPIVFNGDGTLIDGQHRLQACVLANTPFTTVIMRQADSQTALAIDTGLKRKFSDHLRREGHHDVNNLAALIRLALKYDNGTIHTTETPSPHQLMSYFDTHSDISEWTAPGKRIRDHTGIRQTSASLALYLTARLGGDETQDAYSFVDQTIAGTNFEQGSPILTLHKWARRTASAAHQPDTIHQSAIVLKALNAWRQGVSLNMLGWKRGGANAESFPAPWQG